MPSNIPLDAPDSVAPTTASVRDAFHTANLEIGAIADQLTTMQTQLDTAGLPPGPPGPSSGLVGWYYAETAAAAVPGGAYAPIGLSVTFTLAQAARPRAWLVVCGVGATGDAIRLALQLDTGAHQGFVEGRVVGFGDAVNLQTQVVWNTAAAGSHTITALAQSPATLSHRMLLVEV